MAPTPTEPTHWSIPAEREQVATLVREVAGFLEGRGIVGKAAQTAQLVLEELVSNVVRHGLAGDATQAVRVSLAVEPAALVLTVEHDGPAFDPLHDSPVPDTVPGPAPDTVPDTGASVEAGAAGGRGVHRVKPMADEVRCVHDGKTNRVHLRIYR